MLRGRERVGSRVKDWLNPVTDAWVRPSDWPLMPAVGANTFKGLHAVYDTDTNFCTVNLTCSIGTYTVDWGDGTTSAGVTSGTTAYKIYNKTSYTNLGAGAYCSRGYRIAIVTVTPDSGNITAIDLSIRHTSENQVYITQWLDIKWEAAACTSFITYLATTGQNAGMLERCIIGAHNITNFSYMFSGCYSLQSVPLFNTAAGANFASMFYNCVFLQSVPLFNTAAGANFASMFSGCYSLQSVPLFNTASGTNFSYMFSGCYSLQSVPLFNTALGTNFAGMFSGCYSLQSVPLFNTVLGANFTFMFSSCYSLQKVAVPAIEGGNDKLVMNGTNLLTMFYSCRSLQKATLDAPKVSLSYQNCLLATGEIVDIFNNLYGFREIMTINVQPATPWAVNDVIIGTSSGKTCTVVSQIDATNYIVKTRTGTFTDGEEIGPVGNKADQNAGAPAFAAIEHMALDVAPSTTWAVGNTITGVTSGKTCVIVEKFSDLLYSVKNRSGAYTLGEILTNGTYTADQGAANPIFYGRGAIAGVTAPTITITGNWGTAGLSADNNLIATNKGWTIAA